jgi:hypothetical protein
MALVDCHNPFEKESPVDLLFDQTNFPDQLALVLPKEIDFAGPRSRI